MKITMTPAKSSNIKAYGYDAATRTLAVDFVGGSATNHYHNVPPEIASKLAGAESTGRFFSANIRGVFKHSVAK